MGEVEKPMTIDEALDAYREVVKTIGSSNGPGRIRLLDWNIEYVNGQVLPGFVDQALIRRLNDFLSDTSEPVILDCGANIGLSVLNYKRQYPGARITAFEADPKFLPVLKKNLASNGAGDVHVVEAAAWVNNGEVPWFSEGADGSKVVSGEALGSCARVRSIDLGDYLDSPIDLLKLDIEGAEYAVLPHIKDRLACIKNIVVECHVDQSNVAGLADLLSTLARAGFKIGVNTYGPWRDLLRQPRVAENHWEQYLLVAGWREPIVAADAEETLLPYGGVRMLLDQRPASADAFDLLRYGVVEGKGIQTLKLVGPFRKDSGLCWAIRLPGTVPLGDDEAEIARTKLVLFEDGIPLGPSHSLHDDIREKGRGRYSHWKDALYFSVSDNTDPNRNMRKYSALFISD